MPENQKMSATIRDPQVKKEKIEEVIKHLTQYKGYGAGRENVYELGYDANGPVLILHAPIDYNRDLPPEYRYENSYYLESDYPKTGLAFMQDGKYGLLPVKTDYRNTEIVYDTPQKLIDGLLSANPQLTSEQIGVTTEGIIQITGMINDLKMPSFALNYNRERGVIEDANSSNGVGFHVEMVTAHETTLNAMGDSLGENERMKAQANYYGATAKGGNEISDANRPGTFDQSANTRGVVDHEAHVDFSFSDFDWFKMKYANEHYMLNPQHDVREREAENASQSLDLREPQGVDLVAIKRTLELNRIWIDAFNKATGAYSNTTRSGIIDNPAAFAGENTAELFNSMVKLSTENKSVKTLVEKLYEMYPDANKTVALNVLINFVTNPNVAEAFGLTIDMSPESATQYLNELQNDHLREEAEDTGEMVRQMLPPKFN